MSDQDSRKLDELHELLQSVDRRVRGLTVAVIVMAMLLAVAAVFVIGDLVNYFGGDPLLYGSSAIGCAVTGFFAGWIARKRA